MTTNVNLRTPISRRAIRQAINNAYDLGDRDIHVWLDGVPTMAYDWDTSVIVFGNGGELVVARSGEVLMNIPSDEVKSGDHDGYGDIVHIEIDQLRRRLGFGDLEWVKVPQSIDILWVGYHTKGGYYEPPVDDGDTTCTISEFNRTIAGDR